MSFWMDNFPPDWFLLDLGTRFSLKEIVFFVAKFVHTSELAGKGSAMLMLVGC